MHSFKRWLTFRQTSSLKGIVNT
jgi:pyridoxine/pyridoxamine 5'-phosphate oxidase